MRHGEKHDPLCLTRAIRFGQTTERAGDSGLVLELSLYAAAQRVVCLVVDSHRLSSDFKSGYDVQGAPERRVGGNQDFTPLQGRALGAHQTTRVEDGETV